MRKIILDTNFLLVPYQFKVDVFSEIRRICDFRYELCIIDKTIDELKKIIEEQKGKNKMAAKLAILLLKSKDVKIIKSKSAESVDDIILDHAGKDTVVATQDAELKRKLKKKCSGIIVLKNKTHLALLYSI